MRFQFHLRSLFIAVTVLAVPSAYVGWQAKIVREREAMRAWILEHRGDCVGDDEPLTDGPAWTSSEREARRISGVRSWLGDRPVRVILIEAKPEEIDRIRTIFLEAAVNPPIMQ